MWTTSSEILIRINGVTYTLQRRELYTIGGMVGTIGNGQAISTTNVRLYIPFKFRLTTAPTGISVANPTNFTADNVLGVNVACTAVTFINATRDGINIDFQTAAGLTAGCSTIGANNANAVITLTGGAI